LRKRYSVPPMKGDPLENAKLYPYTSHSTEMAAIRKKHCMKTERTFLDLTSPP